MSTKSIKRQRRQRVKLGRVLADVLNAVPTGAIAWVGHFVQPTPVETRVKKRG